MTATKNRLNKLKNKVIPRPEKPPFMVIWKLDGRYYLNNPYTPNGVGAEITAKQYEEYKRDKSLLLVTYVDLIKL